MSSLRFSSSIKRLKGGVESPEERERISHVNSSVLQFDLVCSSEYLRATYQSLYMFGTLFGAPINGLLSDR
ncbi:Solute carrier family 22 member 24 [Portunus trituberculatus]|uniref:Solute carrier family 22 member 24 n=1 Tax=Portunus trituberculatus TaxID=210409 RepID=A0A5B7J3Y0_PORTR|nr:Solute carrier family 22 member 24 [Portunus trituberculatus]